MVGGGLQIRVRLLTLVGLLLFLVSSTSAADWSPFQPPAGNSTAPQVKDPSWNGNRIDRYVFAKLAANDLTPAKEVGRATWLRRVTFDLVGLPPTPEEVTSLLNDPRSDEVAYGAVVDRLLASPHYGEHMARYWLDIVRYSDTDGFAIDDERFQLWRYRDYVIRSFNQDRPYDQFVREQIAGDEFDFGPQGVVATSFFRLGPYERDNMTPENRRQDFLNEMTTTVGSVFLGMTVGCARCHDHKYDEISQADFYRLQAFLQPYERKAQAAPWLDSELTTTVQALRDQAESKLAKLTAARDKHRESLKGKVAEALKVEAKEVDDELFAKALKGEAIPLAAAEKQAASEADAAEESECDEKDEDENDKDENDKDENDKDEKDKDESKKDESKKEKPETFQLDKKLRDKLEALNKAVTDFKPPKRFAAMADTIVAKDKVEDVPATHVLGNGDPFAKEDEVDPGCLSSVASWSSELDERIKQAATLSSGRRKVLADWLANEQNPLTARVYVNRIWQHHFGQGIVATSNDFGENGSGPSHPQLLNDLTKWFVDGGWKTKPLQRLIVLSRAYRSDSDHEHWEECLKVDPENRLLWRAPLRRLRAEVIRDALLMVSGRMNTAAGGPGFFETLPDGMVRNLPFFTWTPSPDAQRRRRSIYMFHRRNLVHPMMEAFDAADASLSCERRGNSVTAAQSLSMFNGKFVAAASRQLATELHDHHADDASRVQRLYWLSFSRDANEHEVKECEQFLAQKREHYRDVAQAKSKSAGDAKKPAGKVEVDPDTLALRDLCMVVFCANEFMYVD